MIYNPFSLEGKTVLVTGASSGIGQETAIQCAKMGATVIITGRNVERLQNTFEKLEGVERNHIQLVVDLTSEGGIDEIVSSVDGLDGLVLCAGKGNTLPMQFSSTEKFMPIFDVNFFAPMELLRLLMKKKKLTKGASVVMIASIGGTRRITFGNGIYGTSKAALSAAMKYCAREYGPQRLIRVNSICPGMVETPLIHGGSLTQEQLDADKKTYPLQRYGQPIDIANAAIYLLSDASSWVTGHDLVVDGGVTA